MDKHAMMPVAAVLILLFAGVAQATTCKAGYKDCDKNYYLNGCEVNVQTDVNNCGDCGYKCGNYCGTNVVPVCKAAKCEFSCKAPFLNCDSNWKNGCEVDGSKDVNNCGACGTKCIAPPYATATCTSDRCMYTCKPGWKNCDGKWDNGCEVDIGKDANNCGNCGTKCPAAPNSTPKCINYKCQNTCKPTFADCDKNPANGCEVCTGTDTSNCGACGVKCEDVPNAITKCNGGSCQYSCKPGYYNCDSDWSNGCEGYCSSDTNNCGACGVKCKDVPNAITKCNGGSCQYSCKPGYYNCDSDWSNGCEGYCSSDTNNCGACGVKCKDVPNAVTKCNGGSCQYSCKPGYYNCDSDWSNGCEGYCSSDTNNCGACGVKCKDVPNAVTKCNGGSCQYSCKPGYYNCDSVWSNGCEGACDSDINNCGSCGVKCSSYPNTVTTCSGGNCAYSCKPGYANCDDNWLNGCECVPDTDTDHCGGCGNKCPTPKYYGGEVKCTNGICETQSCKSGWTWDSSKSCCVEGGKKCFLFLCF